MTRIEKKWQVKLICLVVAVFLWFVIIGEQNPTSEGSYTVPVAVENLDSRYIASHVPRSVYVRLAGPRNTIINIDPSSIKAYVDLSAVKEGTVEAPIHVEIPGGTELKKQSQNRATVLIDVYAVKEFSVTPHIRGQVNGNAYVGNISVLPQKVTVSGARRLLRQVDNAMVEVGISDKTDGFTAMTPVRLLRADGTVVEGLTVTPWQTSVAVNLEPNAATKEVPVVVHTRGTFHKGLTEKNVIANPKTVTLRGDVAQLQSLDHWDLPAVSVTGITKNKTWKLEMPFVNGVTVTPDTIDVMLLTTKE